MPKNQFQRMVFAFITVIITVHAFVFYSLYVVEGESMKAATGETSVLSAIEKMGGVSVLGKATPIWAVILIEFIIAYTLAVLVGSTLSFKLACKVFDPHDTHPVLFSTAVTCATVGIMCPLMSFIASILYYPYATSDMNLLALLASWLKLVCMNLPFAFFSQLFFIQPFVRTVFKAIFSQKAVAVSETV